IFEWRAGFRQSRLDAGFERAHVHAFDAPRVFSKCRLQTGLPYTPQLQTSTTNCCGSRPDRIANGTLSSGQRSITRWFDTAAFTTPPPFTYGNAGRDILFGPGRVNFDMSLFKDFPIREEIKLQFRAEAFNTFNTPQFGQP